MPTCIYICLFPDIGMDCDRDNLNVPESQCTRRSIMYSAGGTSFFFRHTCMTGVVEHGTCINGNTFTVSVWVHLFHNVSFHSKLKQIHRSYSKNTPQI